MTIKPTDITTIPSPTRSRDPNPMSTLALPLPPLQSPLSTSGPNTTLSQRRRSSILGLPNKNGSPSPELDEDDDAEEENEDDGAKKRTKKRKTAAGALPTAGGLGGAGGGEGKGEYKYMSEISQMVSPLSPRGRRGAGSG